MREQLVRAKLHSEPQIEPNGDDLPKAPPACTTRTCRYCPKINTSGRIRCTFNGRSYQTRTQAHCKCNNLIYCISCKRCGLKYVGQTKRRLQDRMSEHFRTITSENIEFAVGTHYSKSNGHSGLDDVEIFILEFLRTPRTDAFRPQRERVEKKWAHRLRTYFPLGLNSQD